MLDKEPQEETSFWREGPVQTKESAGLSKKKGNWSMKRKINHD